MASNAEIKDASYFGPVAEATPTTGARPGNNTVRRPSSNTNTSEELAKNTLDGGLVKYLWPGHFVDVTNESTSDALEFAFSVGAKTLVFGQTSTFEAGSDVAGERLQPGEKRSVLCPPGMTHVNWILGAAGPSTVAFRCSDGVLGDK